jgi:putative transposase
METKVEEGHLMPDHVHMLLSIPPKHSVSQVVGFMKGKAAISIARTYMQMEKLEGHKKDAMEKLAKFRDS